MQIQPLLSRDQISQLAIDAAVKDGTETLLSSQ